MTRPRYGLVGAGPWARMVHLPGAAASGIVEPKAIWARDETAASALASTVPGMRAEMDFERFLESVDVVAFAVPPHVQAPLALQAAHARKSLLLEKPIATSVEHGQAIADALDRNARRGIVFHPGQLDPHRSEWLAQMENSEHIFHVEAHNLSTLSTDRESPFFQSPWRFDRGALWDGATHEIALMLRILGPAAAVTARRGPGDLTTVDIEHAAGGRGTLVTGLDYPERLSDLRVVARSGHVAVPSVPGGDEWARSLIPVALAAAVELDPLVGHPTDVHLGVETVRVVVAAEESIALGRTVRV